MKVNKLERIIIVLLILLALGLRLYQLGNPSLWYDELLELDLLQGSFWDIGPQLIRHAAMPLDYYLLYGWIKLGQHEAWVRFPAAFFGVLAIPLMYKLASSLFNKNVGYLAALLLALASFSIRYSQDARPYAMLSFWTLLCFWSLWRAYQTGRGKYWVGVMGGLAGAALSHYFALFLLAPIALLVGLQLLFHLRHSLYWVHLIYFVICLMVLLTIFAFNGRLRDLYNVGSRFSTLTAQPETLTVPSAQKPNKGVGPPRTVGFVLTGVLIPFSSAEPFSFLLVNSLFLIGLFSFGKAKKWWGHYVLLGWLVLPIVLIYLFLLQRGTFFAVRYILYTLPAYLILVANGFDMVTLALVRLRAKFGISQPQRRGMLAAALTVAVITVWIFGELSELSQNYRPDAREDWRAVGQLLQANAGPTDAVIAVRAEPTLNWYYPPARAPFGAYNTSQPVWAAIHQHPRRWFVLSSYSNKVDAGLRKWLKENQAITIAIDRRIVVYVQQEGVSAKELLAQVRTFALPQKALTYAVLGDQFKAQGNFEASRAFYQKAIELAGTPAQKAEYQARLATLDGSS
jgi:4-amino-4-deoxy-L-arabinose transferase-like glycosyltransferase